MIATPHNAPFPIRHPLCFLTALLACFGAAPSHGQDPGVSASIRFQRDPLYVGERATFTLTIRSRGVRLSQNLSLSGLPDGSTIAFGEFREFPVERATAGGAIEETRRFECDARPRTPGTLRIAPALRIGVLTRRGLLIGSTTVETLHDLPVPPLTVVVRPIPTDSRPPDDSGLVGQFAFDATVSPTNLALGDLVTITMVLRGNGYLDAAVAPRLSPGRSFRAYDPKPVPTPNDRERRFEQIVIPQTPDANVIAPVAFSYFDPDAAAFRRVERGPFRLSFHAPREETVERFRPAIATNLGPRPPSTAARVAALASADRSRLGLSAFSAAYWLVVAAAALRIGLRRPRGRLLSAAVLVLAAALFAPAFSALRAWQARLPDARLATNVTVRFAPSHAAIETFRLNAGARVQILQTHEDWAKIQSDANRGWIPASALTSPRPGPPGG
jgi:hypothetical protein